LNEQLQIQEISEAKAGETKLAPTREITTGGGGGGGKKLNY